MKVKIIKYTTIRQRTTQKNNIISIVNTGHCSTVLNETVQDPILFNINCAP